MAFQWPIFIPVAAACIAAGAAVWGAYSAQKAQAANRKLTNELKIAKFRQVWINDLRAAIIDHTAMLAEISFEKDLPKRQARLVELPRTAFRIQLLMNPKDPDYDKLIAELAKPFAIFDDASATLDPKPAIALSQAILKREWDRLQTDLKKAAE